MSKKSLAKNKIRVLLLEGLHSSALETFEANGYTNIESLKTSLLDDELIAKIKDAHFIGIRS
ncbi:MAG: D-3-phosphoglycerate dehydrogenase, partial [Glaciecola sp.]